MPATEFEEWNARLNAHSPMVSRYRLQDGYPTVVTGALLSFWWTSMRRRKRIPMYRPRPAIERAAFKEAP